MGVRWLDPLVANSYSRPVSQKTAAQPRVHAARSLRRWRALLRALCGVLLALSAGLLALSAEAAASPGLTLETGSPDALCPALPAAREAVERRLGTLVGASGAGWRARYTIAHAPQGAQMDFVRLELFAPDGALQLSRDLPLEAGACSTVAEAIALVLDRYFRKLPLDESAAREAPALGEVPVVTAAQGTAGQGALAAPLLPAGPLPATSSPGSLPVSSAPAAALPPEHAMQAPPPDVAPGLPEMAPEDEPLRRFWRVGAVFATSTAAGPAVGLQALRESWPHLYTGAELALDWSAGSERRLEGTEVSARSLSGALALGWGTRWRALRGYVGPSVRLSWERARATGLAASQERDRARATAGLVLGLVAGLTRHWSVSLTSGLETTLGAGEFRIDGQEVLRPALLEGRLALGLGYSSSL